MSELKNYVEIQAEKAENLKMCRGIKLLHIRKSVEELLSYIGKAGFFEEYTLHNIEHIDEMLKIVEWLIPEYTKEKMTKAEWLMITLAVYFHDLGMVITKNEYEEREKTSFADFKKKRLEKDEVPLEYIDYVNNNDDRFLYQEFVRENHAKRIRNWIEQKDNCHFGENTTIKEILDKILNNLDKLFKSDLGLICESHHNDDIDDVTKYKVSAVYGSSDDERVNLNYIAIILRISDLLHITQDRTPTITRQLINVTNPTSVIEWEKQQAVKAVLPQAKRNSDNNVDETLEKDTISVTAYFDGADTAEAYFGLSAYLQYAKKEIQKCNQIVLKLAKTEGTDNYKFPWKDIDETSITTVGFETKKLHFTLAQESILQLLVGHTLYNDSSVVVRELVQNGIDAVKLQMHMDRKNKKTVTDGEVNIKWDSETRELSFIDNGTGMTIYDIENYLLKVGSSKYREQYIKKEFPEFNSISHFGIGILTCFMIANDIDIVTNYEEDTEANLINLRRVNGSYLLRKIDKSELDNKIINHGTMVTLHVRNDVDMSTLENNLKKWVVLPEIPVWLEETGKEKMKIGYDSLREILVSHLNNIGCVVDGEKFDVYEKKHGNVTVAYAVKYLKYLADWCLMSFDRKYRSKETLPIGTCIEGIRVEFTTPGYKNQSILAVANIKDSNYQTNVARSAIELDANKEILTDIYDVYTEYISEQMSSLEIKNYSKTWALEEGKHLMRPLLVDRDYHSEPVDDESLLQSLSQLKSFVVESDDERRIISANDVHSMKEFTVYESKLTQAAEQLLKEVKTDATLNNILAIVRKENQFVDNKINTLCNYDPNDMLHQYALRDKEVEAIKVDREHRMIQIKYSTTKETWYEFCINSNMNVKKVFIPKKEFTIEGLEEEIGVKAFGSIYVDSRSDLYRYIVKVIQDLSKDKSDENIHILDIFISSIFEPNVLESIYKDNSRLDDILKVMEDGSHRKFSPDLKLKMKSKIDMTEFGKYVLGENHSLYSIYNWSR